MQSFFSDPLKSRTFRQLGGLACAAMLLAACSGGGGNDGGGTPAAPASISGIFVDSPVNGLRYTTTSNPGGGFTSAGGRFQCQSGDLVTFWIGTKQIGSPQLCSSDAVTAVSVLGASSVTDPQVVNLSQLLMTLGPIVNNVIQIPQPLPAGFNSALVPAFTDPNFDTAVLAALPVGTLLVSNAQATLQLQASLKMLTVTIINGGSVTSTPTGILNCTALSGTCSAAFQTGAVVTLTATGTGFTGWSGGTGSVSCTGTSTCTSTVNADSLVTATFPVAPPPVALTISKAGTGTGTVTCSVSGGAFGVCAPSYPNGTALTLQGVAAAGSTFTGWSLGTGNISCAGINNCAVTLTADSTVTANFTLPIQVSVTGTPATGNGGGGTVQCSANGGAAGPCGSYLVGTPISIIPTPNPTSNFTGWTNGTGSVTANCSSATGACNFTLTATTSITANFNRPTLTVVVNGTGSVSSNLLGINNCTTNCSAPFDKGIVILTAAGTGFTGWSGGGCSGSGTCPVTLNPDTTVTANFSQGTAWVEEAYLKPQTPGAGQFFGNSLAVSGDMVAVGKLTGEVSIFSRNSTTNQWSRSSVLAFGGSVASTSLALDGNTLAVAGVMDPLLGVKRVELYTRNNQGKWAFDRSIFSPTSSPLAVNWGANSAGVSEGVILSGSTLVLNNIGVFTAGSVAIYRRDASGSWSLPTELTASKAIKGDNFGWASSLSGNILAVGASEPQGSGSVYVFTYDPNTSTWSSPLQLKSPTPKTLGGFGASVAVLGDLLAIGAAGENAVYLFAHDPIGGTWTQTAKLSGLDYSVGGFGTSVSLAGGTLVAGSLSPVNIQVEPQYGKIHVLTKNAIGTWIEAARITASNSDVGDGFGKHLMFDGATILVGANAEAGNGINPADNSLQFAGAAYVFRVQ